MWPTSGVHVMWWTEPMSEDYVPGFVLKSKSGWVLFTFPFHLRSLATSQVTLHTWDSYLMSKSYSMEYGMLSTTNSRVPPRGTLAKPMLVHWAGRPGWCSLVSKVQPWNTDHNESGQRPTIKGFWGQTHLTHFSKLRLIQEVIQSHEEISRLNLSAVAACHVTAAATLTDVHGASRQSPNRIKWS